MTGLQNLVTTALVHSIWQDTAIGVVLWAALAWLRRSSANARYLLACAGLTAMVVLPIGTAVWLTPHPNLTPLGVIGTATRTATRPSPAERSTATTPVRGHAPTSSAALEPTRLTAWLFPLWTAGVLCFSLR